MVRDGIPFVLVPVLVAAGFGLFGFWPIALFWAALAAFMLYFFRDPDRVVPDEPGLIISSADGKVTRVDETADGKLVSVFLSPLDVHVNRSPIAGNITNITYVKGAHRAAMGEDTSLTNERNSLVIEGDGLTITCTQIAGILARRIVCWPQTGDRLERGQRFGMIKFGSRTDILMPREAAILVSIGDKVRGGETIIARIADEKR
jgi:phosphatidylserine decarboxylase